MEEPSRKTRGSRHKLLTVDLGVQEKKKKRENTRERVSSGRCWLLDMLAKQESAKSPVNRRSGASGSGQMLNSKHHKAKHAKRSHRVDVESKSSTDNERISGKKVTHKSSGKRSQYYKQQAHQSNGSRSYSKMPYKFFVEQKIPSDQHQQGTLVSASTKLPLTLTSTAESFSHVSTSAATKVKPRRADGKLRIEYLGKGQNMKNKPNKRKHDEVIYEDVNHKGVNKKRLHQTSRQEMTGKEEIVVISADGETGSQASEETVLKSRSNKKDKGENRGSSGKSAASMRGSEKSSHDEEHDQSQRKKNKHRKSVAGNIHTKNGKAQRGQAISIANETVNHEPHSANNNSGWRTKTVEASFFNSPTRINQNVQNTTNPSPSLWAGAVGGSNQIRVGDEYQVNALPKMRQNRKVSKFNDVVLWPGRSSLSRTKDVDKYVAQFPDHIPEALEVLYKNNFNTDVATVDMFANNMCSTSETRWNDAECSAFHLAIQLFGLDFRRIAQLIPTRTRTQVTQYYFDHFKFSSRYKHWKKTYDKLMENEEPLALYSEDVNDIVCAACGEGGDGYCCDSCPTMYHADCLKSIPPDNDEKWFCPNCSTLSSEKRAEQMKKMEYYSNLVLEFKNQRRVWPKQNHKTLFGYLLSRRDENPVELVRSLKKRSKDPVVKIDGYHLEEEDCRRAQTMLEQRPLDTQLASFCKAGNLDVISNTYETDTVASALLFIGANASHWKSMIKSLET